MEMIVYLKVKEEELPRCKEFAFVEGKESSGYKYYLVDPSLVNMQNPVHESCTCKVVVVTILDQDNSNEHEDEAAAVYEEIGSADEKKAMERFNKVNNLYAKENFKLADGQAKPTSLNGWKEIVVNANIELLDRVTKMSKEKTYGMLP